MAILRGFPPSNSIFPTTYIPDIVETSIKIGNLEVEEKFRTEDGSEYLKLKNASWECRAICYKSKTNEAGAIYGFDINREVIWLRKSYKHVPLTDVSCCQKCGEKLIIDEFSNQYGDWCPNPSCSN